MPTNVANSLTKPVDTIGNTGSFILNSIPWIIGAGILALIIWWVWFKEDKRLNKAFGRRRIELETGAKLSKDPSIKFVYVWQSGRLKKVGKYAGHLVLDKHLYVLLRRHFVVDIVLGHKLIVAPVGAMKEIYEDKHKDMLLIGKGFSYDISKDMYVLNGEWKGLNISVSASLIDKNALELLEEYGNKIAKVQDQMVEQLDLELKKKLKTGEDVVSEED